MSLYAKLTGNGPSGFGYASTAEDVTVGVDLRGRTILLTGCNSGIGFESLRVLAARGARVIALARTEEKARDACAKVEGETIPLACELADLESVMACVHKVRALGMPIDVLLLNAGIMALPRLQLVRGREIQFFTNHVGHHLLATRLLDTLSDDARVVVLSSRAHTSASRKGIDFENLDGSKGYSPIVFYGQSKLANLLFARELARRFEGSGRIANAVHPGVIHTNLGRHIGSLADIFFAVAGPLALKDIPQGAATQCWAAAHPDAGRINGEYLSHSNVAKSNDLGRDMELAARLWDYTEALIEEVLGDDFEAAQGGASATTDAPQESPPGAPTPETDAPETSTVPMGTGPTP